MHFEPNYGKLFDRLEASGRLVTRISTLLAAEHFADHCSVTKLDLFQSDGDLGHFVWSKNFSSTHGIEMNLALVSLIGYAETVSNWSYSMYGDW